MILTFFKLTGSCETLLMQNLVLLTLIIDHRSSLFLRLLVS